MSDSPIVRPFDLANCPRCGKQKTAPAMCLGCGLKFDVAENKWYRWEDREPAKDKAFGLLAKAVDVFGAINENIETSRTAEPDIEFAPISSLHIIGLDRGRIPARGEIADMCGLLDARFEVLVDAVNRLRREVRMLKDTLNSVVGIPK